MGKARWGRGFFRLWVGFSLVWCICAFFLARPDETYTTIDLMNRQAAALTQIKSDLLAAVPDQEGPWTKYQSDDPTKQIMTPETVQQGIDTLKEKIAESWARFQQSLIAIAFGPILTFSLGFLVKWILLGFRSTPPNNKAV